jgi:hypothetical protein
MSRSGYSDEGDHWDMIRWRGAVKSAMRGKRGQAFLRELRDTLDAMPEKRLVSGAFRRDTPEIVPKTVWKNDGGMQQEIVNIERPPGVCTIGSVLVGRGMDDSKLGQLNSAIEQTYGSELSEIVAKELGIAPALVAEVMYMNDEYTYDPDKEKPEDRWQRIRDWVEKQLSSEDS